MEIWSKKFNIGNEGKVLYYFHWWQNWIENGISCVSAHGCPICYLLFLIMANCPRLTIVSPWHSFSLNIDTSNFNFPKLYIIIIIIIIVIIIYRREVKDLSTFYKMKNRHFNSSWNSCFQFCFDERLRSHSSSELKINRVRTERFKGTFFNRILYLWNNLPDELRTANSSLSSFKRLCTIFYKDKVFDPECPYTTWANIGS